MVYGDLFVIRGYLNPLPPPYRAELKSNGSGLGRVNDKAKEVTQILGSLPANLGFRGKYSVSNVG